MSYYVQHIASRDELVGMVFFLQRQIEKLEDGGVIIGRDGKAVTQAEYDRMARERDEWWVEKERLQMELIVMEAKLPKLAGRGHD